MSEAAYTWRGVDRRGTARGGRLTTSDLAGEVAARFTKGWRSLTVFRDDVEAAGIRRNPETGKPCWWAESAAEIKISSEGESR
jgi:hypothetical protein